MDYSKKLQELKTSFTFDCSKYDQAADFDLCVVILRSNGMNYADISKILGSPAKKTIRKSLLSWAPELIEIDVNRNKAQSERATEEEWRLLNYMKRNNQFTYIIEGESWTFFEDKGRIYYNDSRFNNLALKDWDIACRKQIVNSIINN